MACTDSSRGRASGSRRCAREHARRRKSSSTTTATWDRRGHCDRTAERVGGRWRSPSPSSSRSPQRTASRCTPASTAADAPTGSAVVLAARRSDRPMAGHVHASHRVLARRRVGTCWCPTIVVPPDTAAPYQQALRGRWGELDVSDTVDVIGHAHLERLGLAIAHRHRGVIGRWVHGARRRRQQPGTRPRRRSSHIPSPTCSISRNAVTASSGTTPIRSSGRCPPLRRCTTTVHRSTSSTD